MQMSWLVALMTFVALLDAFGVASIMPILALFSNPDIISGDGYLAKIYTNFGFEHPNQLLIWLSAGYVILLILVLSLRALLNVLLINAALLGGFIVSERLMKSYLSQPYQWFIVRNSSDLSKKILSEVDEVMSGILLPLLVIISQALLTFAILTILIIIEPVFAISVFCLFAIAYILIFQLANSILFSMGQKRVVVNEARFQAVYEAFGAIKEIKLIGKENHYVSAFANPARLYARYQSIAQAIAFLPRYALEALAFTALISAALVISLRGGDALDALPLVGVFAFSGYRLMPALQQVYASMTQVKFSKAALEDLVNEVQSFDIGAMSVDTTTQIGLKNNLTLKNICFTYPGSNTPSLDGLNLKIESGQRVGVVGRTGSGKSTLLDLILGLLEPTSGEMFVDGKNFKDIDRRHWQNSIGYVAQHVYVSDNNLSQNIALGVEPSAIDQQRVISSAKDAQLTDVLSKLPEGYDTKLGDSGQRFSGGQKQRLAIARALYRKPSILILDEATSALDNHTERLVVQSLRRLGDNITSIMIAHRLNTIRDCDQILVMEAGRIVDAGTYEYLLKNCEEFRQIAVETR